MMGYLSRFPTSNDPPRPSSDNRWIEETDAMDEVALLLNGLAKRCRQCNQAARLKYLDKEHRRCPDCRPGEPAIVVA